MVFSSKRRYPFASKKKVSKKAIVKICKAVIEKRQERKWFNLTPFAAVASNSSWQFASALAGLTQGTTENNRLGQKIFVREIQFQILVLPQAGNITINSDWCRLVVYHNKETNGTLITYGSLFDANVALTLPSMNLKPKATIVRDMRHHMIATSAAAGASTSVGPQMFQQLSIYPRKVVDFQSNAGTISDLLKDDWGFGFCATAANCCKLSLITKVIFHDM